MIKMLLKLRLEEFPFYQPKHYVNVRGDDKVYIRYSPTIANDRANFFRTRFVIQVDPEACYILDFHIAEEFRGEKNGTKLVDLICGFVNEEFRISRFRVTPSGMALEHGFYESCGFEYFDGRQVQKII